MVISAGDRDARHPGPPEGATDRGSELRYRTLIEQSPLSTQVFAPDGTALAANAAWERLWGTSRNELPGYNILHDRQLVDKGVMPYIKRAFAGEAVEIPPIRYDPEETGKPGRSRWVRAHCFPLKDEAGTMLEVILVLEDVTAQQENEQALRESEERYRVLFEEANDAILVADDEGRYLDANRQAEVLTGYSREELRMLRLSDLTPETVSDGGHRHYQEFVLRGRMSGEYTIRRKDGATVEVEFSATRVAPGRYQSILRDVTARKRADRQLALYREIFANAADAIAVIDPQGYYLEQNAAHRFLVGYSDEELRGCTPAIHFGEEAFATIADTLTRLGHYRGEHTSRAKGGVERQIELVAFAVRDEAGQPVCFVGIKRDVSERTQTQAALRESEERYRVLVEHSPEAIAVHQQGVLVYVNPAGARLVGAASPDELVGRSILEFVHPDYRSLVVQRMRQVQTGRELATPAHERFLRLDGTPIDVEVLAIPTTYEGVPASQVIVRDITEQRRAAERMARLQAVTAALSSAVTPAEVARVFIDEAFPTVGAEGGIVVMLDESTGEFEMIGAASYPEEALAAWRRFSMDAPVPVADAVRERQPVLLESAEEASSRYGSISALAASRAIGAIAALPLVVEDRVIGAMSLRFVGPRTFTEGDQAFLDALAHQCAQALDRALVYEVERQTRRAAEEATRLRDEFLSVAAHELKTPMTSLRGYAQVALRRLEREGTLDRERLERTLGAVDAQTAKLSRLVNQLLDISRLQAGRLTLDLETIDVLQLVRSVVEAAQSSTERHTIAVHASPVVQARIDPLRIEQVLINLLDNAIKYSSGGEITVDVAVPNAPDASSFTISVRDRGEGIAPEVRSQIFDRFYRAHTESHASGMGLGLYISRQIVELHGGHIEAEFPEDGGTRFVVTLPLRQGE